MIDVLYEDNHVIAAVKPQNIPSQEDASKDLDMLTMVKQYIGQKYAKPGNVYIGLLHRLDRPCGGVMLFARTSKAASRLSSHIREGEFIKEYLAISNKSPAKKSGVLTDYLLKRPARNSVMVVTKDVAGAKEAILYYEVLGEKHGKTLFRVVLKTGRPHQIRVQLANMGCPLLGDVKYGKIGGLLCLWSTHIGFIHPVNKNKINVYSLPQGGEWTDFEEVIDEYSQTKV